eukprot:CAMPEP_0172444098 /NCGR_PEP_ID=MMETSP1065-20121228/4211_1 /TAXON_ID=265537 /ORGANISM="Amphiprora paludosa, Strain CCMP125" /LENGTH=474 /DNA_ID=CAMNT_0013194517 /DNA_START=199 /DNA_END=1623 /DNA_ORIENTATION=+
MSDSKAEGSATTQRCGIWELVIFVLAIVTGTACSICSKTMMELPGVGITGEEEVFEKPIFQTFGMFVGMLFGLVMHWIVLIFKIPFPGYDHTTDTNEMNDVERPAHEQDPLLKSSKMPSTTNGSTLPNKNKVPGWMYWFLAIPSIFDLAATALCMMGLRYLDVSIYQLLRGSGIIFVALMKQHVLGDRLYRFQWLGVFWNVVAVFMVGATAIMNSSDADESIDGNPGNALLGVSLVMLGAFVQALQFVFEEKVMTLDEAAVPPLLLIGMEGLWGTILCLVVVYPLVYFLPGEDHGSYEDPFNTYAMFMNSPVIQYAFIVYFFAIFGYNLFAVLVTFALNSVWHAILDNFRPITVWLTDLAIYYVFTGGAYGETWTVYSYLQLAGMMVLLYGTSVYNAPHAGSVKLKGQWWALWVDLSSEYDAVEEELHEAELHDEWEQKREEFKMRRPSSMAERSPHVSIHTQALAGMGTHKIV